jgi:hypothetical protein
MKLHISHYDFLRIKESDRPVRVMASRSHEPGMDHCFSRPEGSNQVQFWALLGKSGRVYDLTHTAFGTPPSSKLKYAESTFWIELGIK